MADQKKAQPRLGNYLLMKQLGQGGFAMVFLGEHVYLKTRAAIKVLRVDPRLLTSNDLDHFLIEARTIANLEHPHIVRVREFDVDDNVPFLVMDYASNGSLAARHPRGSILQPATVVQYVKQVASALQYAHDQRVIHCDVKPENMFVGRNNEVLLGDFGIAVAVQNVTKTGEVIGTVYYMAPEQFAGKPRPASDQYALAVAAYQWLCGRLPFEGTSPIELYRLHTEVLPPPLRKFVPDIPREVEQVVLTALAKDPKQRFTSVEAFANALEAALQPTPQPRPQPQPQPRPQPQPQPRPRPLPSDDLTEESEPLLPLLPTLSSLLPTIPAPVAQRSRPIPPPNEALPPPSSPTYAPLLEEPLDESTILSVSLSPPIPRALVVPFSSAEPGNCTYNGHAGWVCAVAWSPDGQRIASGSWDKTVQIWDAASAQTMLTYSRHTNTVKAVAWSPDGTYIASGSWDNTVRVWLAATGDDLPHYEGHSAQVEAVAWSPNGASIASASHDCTVQVWKVANRATLLTYRGHAAPVWSVTWSPDGQYIASASHDQTVQVWRASSGEHVFTYQGHTAQVSAVAWSPDGQHIASASHDGVLQIWHISSGKTLFSSRDAAGAVKALGWSPDGRSIASAVKTVQVWDAQVVTRRAGSNPIFTYQGHPTWINALAWSPDGRSIASASDDRTVQVWRPL